MGHSSKIIDQKKKRNKYTIEMHLMTNNNNNIQNSQIIQNNQNLRNQTPMFAIHNPSLCKKNIYI